MQNTRRDLVDRLLNGGLVSFLAAGRAENQSYYTLSLRLRDEHGIDVNPASIRRWAIELGAHEPTAPAPAEAAS